LGTEVQDVPAQNELLLPSLSRRAAAVDVVIMVLFILVTGYALAAWDDAYRESHPMSKDVVGSWLLPVVFVGLLGLALAALQTKLGKLSTAALGLRREKLAVQVLWGCGGAALSLLVNFLGAGVLLALIAALRRTHVLSSDGSLYQGESTIHMLQNLSVGTVIVGMAIIVLAEEAMFRGIILPRLRRITGHWWSAVLICSLLFGFYHRWGGLGLAGATTLMSVVFCLIFIRSRSLVASSVAHFLYNMTLYQMARTWPTMGVGWA
jgi:membrane protease YdiL (CAAX protease family)